MSDEEKYLLGHGQQEWQRLADQHQVWRHTLLDSLHRQGFSADSPSGDKILEVGCGSGVLLADLAELAAPGGRAVGVEIDPATARYAGQWLGSDGPRGTQIEVHQGDVMSLDLGERFDLVVARWVLSFLSQPKRAIELMVEHLEPGGLILIQDYNYDALRVTPGDPALDRLFEVMPEAYALHGGDAWLATRLPRLYAELGLELVAIEPHCLSGPPESPIFRWVETFFRQHSSKLVADGLLSAAEREASLQAWDAVHQVPGTVLFSPLVVNVIGRKPEKSWSDSESAPQR